MRWLLGNCAFGHGSALATTDGQVAAHGSSIAAQTTGLSNKADQLAFDVLEGVVAKKSTPDSVDLSLNYSTTAAAMNGSIASANNATSLFEGVFQMVFILPKRLLALVRPAFDLVLQRIQSLKRCVQA